MVEHSSLGLKIVDGATLDASYQEVLRPGALVRDARGRTRRLPRYFYEIDSWKSAEATRLAEGFSLYEFVNTDVREAEMLRGFPRYVPCAVTVLATYLSILRRHVDTYVHVAANGGYRSPGHAVGDAVSLHHWGTAVNIYRIGDDYLEEASTIQRYAEIVREVLPTAWIRPYGHGPGFADDHLHLDLGFLYAVPREAESEEDEKQDPETADVKEDDEA